MKFSRRENGSDIREDELKQIGGSPGDIRVDRFYAMLIMLPVVIGVSLNDPLMFCMTAARLPTGVIVGGSHSAFLKTSFSFT